MNNSHTLPICACGCGQPIPFKPHHRYHPPKYLPNHLQATGPRAYTPKPEEIPSGICECGCGKSTPLAKVTYRNLRHFRGHPIPFLQGHTIKKKGEASHKWHGGRTIDGNGYVMIYAPEHPNVNQKGYVPEHRLVMERKLGRYLQEEEIVHHMNHQVDDNREENLMLLTKGQHSALHAPDRVYNSDTMSAVGKKGAAARWSKH